MSVEKRNGRYLVRWRDSSGQQRSKTVALWRDAVTLDGEMKRKRAMGELISHERGKIRLNDFWEVWWTNYAMTNLSLRTRRTYGRLWKTHVEPALGSSSLLHVGPEQVSSLGASLASTMAPSSVRKVLAILQGVLERAVEWGYIPTNPAKGVRRPKLVQRRGRVITQQQLDALCAELDLRSSTIAKVLVYSGLRPGELRALVWGQVGASQLRVDSAASGSEVGPTKTNRVRTVPLNSQARKALSEWLLFEPARGAHDYVFPGRNGKLWSDSGWNHWQQCIFTPAASRAGLAGLVPYDLRHTCVSAMIASGMVPTRVAQIAGHSLQVLLTTYAHEFELVYSERHANYDEWQIPSNDGRFHVLG